jgi:DNA-binding transcriptional ArsR family regulator
MVTAYMSKKSSKTGPTAEEFVKAAEESETLDEMAERLGMSKAIISARMSKYRAMGVHIKRLARKKTVRSVDVERLNDIIKRIRNSRPSRNQ